MHEHEHAHKTDQELVRLTLQNRDNFLYLVQRYEEKLTGYIHRLTNISREDAQDLLQEIFIKVYTNLHDYDNDLKFSSWIYRITHNHVISSHRKRQSGPQTVILDTELDLIENLASDLNLEKEMDNNYLHDKIIKVLNNLNPKYRDVLVLKFLEQKDYREISDILKKPLGTVGTLINRAKKEFRKEYRGRMKY